MDYYFLLILYIVLFLLLSIPIHELGHLVFGLLTGYRFSSFRLFSFVLYNENAKLKLKRSKTRFILGQCLMSPPADEANFRFVWYNLGGGLFNLLFSAMLFVALVQSSQVTVALISGVTVSAAMGLMNLIPMALQIPNDGMNILKALQSPEARHGLYINLRVNNEMANGKRLRDYDDKTFAVSDSADLSNYIIASLVNCEASRLYDCGLYDESIKQFERLNLDKLPSFYKRAYQLDYLYYYCVHAPDYDKAKQIYAQPQMSKFLNLPQLSTTRTLAAYRFFVTGSKDTARELLQKAKVQIDHYPNLGIRLMEKDYLDHLEKLMQAQPR